MKAEKKLSIKIKSKAGQHIMDDPEIEVITEWNLKRIISAIIAFLIFIVVPAYYFSHQGDTNVDKYEKNIAINHESIIKKQDAIKVTNAKEILTASPIVQVPSVKPAEEAHKEIKPETVVTKEEEQPQTSNSPSDTQYSNPHITRAQLALGINKLTPYGQVDLPLLVDNTEAQGLFYFTEVS
ncbi:MAG: hypothetical protein GQ529_08590, partial [Methyloprofundus sp.]|nr:hypothetical protein [Methyloprofundus sp.]